MSKKLLLFKKYLKRNIFYIYSLVTSTLFLSIFILILRNIEPNEFFSNVDQKATSYIITKRTNFLTQMMKLFTFTANKETVILIFILLSAYLYKTKHWNTLIAFIISVGGGQLFVTLVKLMVKRERPDILNRLMSESSFSFPSGHSFMVVCLYGFILYICFKLYDDVFKRTASAIAVAGLVLGVGFSRVYLGVHWLSDVLGSYFSALAWLSVNITLLEIKRSRDAKKKKSISSLNWR